ncbi:MAG TPA: LysM peptidoglycan-binding domain-containing protein [Patescibacteria group bacterium]|nr:LysM peptidoglycan-binding domain-containing protein [Patescibacteria group bacterium]
MLRSRLAFAALAAFALVGGPILATAARAADEIVVRPGQTLTSISREHGVSIEQLVELNDIANPSRIYAGQRLRLEGAPAAAAPVKPVAAPAAPRTHTVRSGEHLTGIARHYGVTIAEVVAANGIADASRIYAGQRLTIPGAAPAAAPSASVGRPMPATMAQLVARRAAVGGVIEEEARRFGVPPAFALAVAWQESGWQQGVVSSAGAIGVMQLLPTTAEWVGEAMLGTTVDPRDLRHNVRAGVRLLAHYLERYDGDRAKVLAAYYQGQTAVDRHGIYRVSRPYITSIAALEALFAD